MLVAVLVLSAFVGARASRSLFQAWNATTGFDATAEPR
jgi:hypothetical protein